MASIVGGHFHTALAATAFVISRQKLVIMRQGLLSRDAAPPPGRLTPGRRQLRRQYSAGACYCASPGPCRTERAVGRKALSWLGRPPPF